MSENIKKTKAHCLFPELRGTSQSKSQRRFVYNDPWENSFFQRLILCKNDERCKTMSSKFSDIVIHVLLALNTMKRAHVTPGSGHKLRLLTTKPSCRLVLVTLFVFEFIFLISLVFISYSALEKNCAKRHD